MNSALVSIIIPLYNAEPFIEETVQSALNQTWQNKEIIIVDDGSTDNSLSIAKSLEGNQVKVLSQPNKGASAARNYGFKESSGEYIQFLDADDLLDSKKIELQLQVLNKTHKCIAFGRCIHFFGADGDFKKIEQKHPQLNYEEDNTEFIKKLYGAFPEIPGSMIEVHSWLTPRNVIEKAGYWNEELSVDDDGEYFLRVLLASEKVYHVNPAICYYRKNKSASSLAAQIVQKKGFRSSLKAVDLKFKLLEPLLSKQELESIFSKFYWEKALFAYPEFQAEYQYCSQRAKDLNYNGRKFMGGANAAKLSGLLGWKAVRYLQYIQQKYIK